ncbi:MAG TPA: hypothetical protein VIY73_04350, partial [Polyangiaceae bacterium]
MQEAAQSPRNPLAPPTPTSAFNTAELVEEARRQALSSGEGSSGFSQPITMPNAFPAGVPGLKPRSLPVPPLPPSPASGRHSAPPGVPPVPGPHPFPSPQPLPAPPMTAPTSGQYPASMQSAMLPSIPSAMVAAAPGQAVSLRAELPRDVRAAAAHVVRSRAYAFVLDVRAIPIEV